MQLKQKYIKTKDKEIIVFSELLQHSDFKHFEPVSAGFINIYADFNTNKHDIIVRCECYGESVSLNLKSEEIDTTLAKKQILGYTSDMF